MTCKDCYYEKWCWTKEYSAKYSCLNFRRKEMSNKIEIQVLINGKPAKLSDVSDETIANIKKAEVKPIEHGDFGYVVFSRSLVKHIRLFVKSGNKITAYDENGTMVQNDVNDGICKYTTTGNVFKDMKNKS